VTRGSCPLRQGGIGNTALHWAAARDSQQALAFLLKRGAATSVRNASGATPLHSAAANGAVSALEALLRAGADTAAVDEDGRRSVPVAHPRTLCNPSATTEPLPVTGVV